MTGSRSGHKATYAFIVMTFLLGIFAFYSYLAFTGQVQIGGQQAGVTVISSSGTKTIVSGSSTSVQTPQAGYACIGSSGATGVTDASSLPIRSTLTKVGSDSALTALVDNRFVAGTTGGSPSLVQQSDTAPSTDGTAATGSAAFVPNSGWVEQFSASGAYPIWVNVGPQKPTGSVAGMTIAGYGTGAGQQLPPNTINFGQSVTEGGINVVTLNCYNAGNQQYDWNFVASPIQAPSTGTTSTTNIAALVTSSSGATLTAATTKMPTTSLRWDVYAQITQTYKGYGYPTAFYGTSGNPVTNYGTLSSPTAGVSSMNTPLWAQTYLVIFANQTGLQITLDSAAGSLIGTQATIVKVTSNLLSSGTAAWIIGPLNGCSPSSGSTSSNSKYNCLDVPIDIYESATQGTKHVNIQFLFVDMQQGGYVIANIATPAQTAAGFTLQGSFSGVSTGFTVLTPTTGGNAGNPASLGQPNYIIIQTY